MRHVETDTAMPPRQKLPAVEIALLETWVLLGAPTRGLERLKSAGVHQQYKCLDMRHVSHLA